MRDPVRGLLGLFGGAWAAVALGLGLVAGPMAAAGWVLGVLGAGAGLLGWWVAITGLGRAMAGERVGPLRATVAVVAITAKLPLVLLAWRAAECLGSPAPSAFLGGLASVYCALVAWALVRR